MDFEAQDDGVVAKILVQAGPDEIKCGEPILVTVEEDEDISAFADFKAEATSVAATPAAAEPPAPTPAVAPTAPAPAPASAPSPSPPPAGTGRVVASPLAHTLAKEMGYNIQSISGTGPGGRIIAADVKEYVPGTEATAAAPATAQTAGAAAPAAAPVLAGPPVKGDGFTDFPISDAAQEMGARLAQSKRNVPHYYLTVDITMDNLLKTRASLNDALGGDAPQLGVYEFLLKAAASSMKAVPSANASWMESVVRVYESVDINVVVGSGDTLSTPVIRDCGKKGVKGISDDLAGAMAFVIRSPIF